MRLFISPRTAERTARERLSNRKGWTFNVEPRRVKNADGSVDIGFGVSLYDSHGSSAGVLR